MAIERQRAIIALERGVGLEGLDPTARLQGGVGLLEELRPIADGADEVAHVDEVEGVGGPGPRQLGVVDLELAVGRDPVGLDGRQVGPEHLGARVLVGEVDRPDARPRADVEHLLDVLAQRRQVQLPVEQQRQHVVVDVYGVVLAVVVGPPIARGVLLAMVCPPVDSAVIHDAGRQGCRRTCTMLVLDGKT